MLLEQLISSIVPTLQPTDTAGRALDLMEQNNFTQLPLITEDRYLALVQETDVLDWEKPEAPLSFADFLNYRPAVFVSGHPYEALRLAAEQDLSIVPVVDAENNYMGAITRSGLLKYITESGSYHVPGGIIVLEVAPTNYSLCEIARIFENEDVTITSNHLRMRNDTGLFEVTLKTNRSDLRGVIASLERYNYTVKQVYGEKEMDDDMVDRFKNLMNFINI